MVFYKKKMRWLLFTARLAFICNVLFILCLLIRYTHNFIHNNSVESYVIILGFFVSFILNITVNLTELILLLSRKQSPVPNWLKIANALIFITQLTYYFL